MYERFNARTFQCTNVSMQFSNQQSVYCYYIYISYCGFGLNMHVDFVLRICKLFYSAYTTRTYTEGIVHNVISWIWSIRSYYTVTAHLGSHRFLKNIIIDITRRMYITSRSFNQSNTCSQTEGCWTNKHSWFNVLTCTNLMIIVQYIYLNLLELMYTSR